MMSGVGPAPPASSHRPVTYPLVGPILPLGVGPTAPGRARAHVRATLAQWGLSAYADVAELLMSEMVTNAVQASAGEHAGPEFRCGRLPVIVIHLVATRDGVVLEVWDTLPTSPSLGVPGALQEHGRGLLLVDALAHRWDWRTVPDWPGKCVWAELDPSSLRSGLGTRAED